MLEVIFLKVYNVFSKFLVDFYNLEDFINFEYYGIYLSDFLPSHYHYSFPFVVPNIIPAFLSNVIHYSNKLTDLNSDNSLYLAWKFTPVFMINMLSILNVQSVYLMW